MSVTSSQQADRDLNTFISADISLTDPSGNAIAVSNPTLVSGNTYRFTFSPQNGNGVYNLAIGPNVDDLAGNPMDQNQDDVNGDPVTDVFHDSFSIQLPALVVDSLTPQANSAVFGDFFTLGWVVHNIGTAAVPVVNWTDAVYLSPSPTLDASGGASRHL